jgi:hypothetical protein
MQEESSIQWGYSQDGGLNNKHDENQGIINDLHLIQLSHVSIEVNKL